MRMGMSEREHHIKTLENLLSHYMFRKECEECEGYYDSTLKDNVEALQYATSSLKIDLKYDLMYEGEEIYTKADMVAMLTELQLEIEGLPYYHGTYDHIDRENVIHKIQQKINVLKGEV